MTNATLHNADYIKGIGNKGEPIRDGRDIRVGDMVIVQRAGDVIPQIVDVVLEKREATSRSLRVPRVCPVCGSHAVRDINEKTGKVDAVTRCTGGFICRAQATEHLKHFVSRNAFDIEGLGSKQIDFFFENEDPALQVRTAPDIFTLRDANSPRLPSWRISTASVRSAFPSSMRPSTSGAISLCTASSSRSASAMSARRRRSSWRAPTAPT